MATGTSRWSLGWDDVQVEAFQQFKDHHFEALCAELVQLEVEERFAERAEFEPPPPRYASGQDFGFRVKSPPKKSGDAFRAEWSVAPLTRDEVAHTVFSCKTGAHWRKTVLEEARSQSEWALEALLEGGFFVLIVHVPIVRGGRSAANQPTSKAQKKRRPSASTPRASSSASRGATHALQAELAHIYGDRMRLVRPSELDPVDRIRIIDANDLKDYVRHRKPNEISLPFRNQLGAQPIPGLLSLDEWRFYHDRDRSTPAFVIDPTRAKIQEQLRLTLVSETDDPYGHAVWLVGAPGVGKTRLVVETLLGDDMLRKRAVVAPSVEEAIAAARDHQLHEQYPTAVLIVDDCPPHELDRLMPWLASSNHHAKGGLVVLTPMAPEWSRGERTLRGVSKLELEPMNEGSLKELITQELGAAGSTSADLVARLTEGFPWYAVLVAKEIRLGASPPTTTAGAAKLALCPRTGHTNDDWETEVRVRARALLVAMLTEDVAWSSLGDSDRDDLCRAVGLTHWSEVEKAALACRNRGLLRIRLKDAYRYVTPAILEREVARMLLDPPDGTDPRGPALEKHARRFLPRFYERLQQLGIEEAILSELSRPIVRALEADPPGLVVLGRGGVSGAALRFAARYLPQEVAHLLRRRIGETPLDELRARTDLRRDLVFVLQSLAGRRSGFDDAEPALFRLAVAENEAFGNNASGVWAGLYLIELNTTYARFIDKIPLLREHYLNGDQASRLVALNGLATSLSIHNWTLAAEELDGPHPIITYADARAARLSAWTLLAEWAGEPDSVIASKVRSIIMAQIAGALSMGLADEVARLVLPLLQYFGENELRQLRDTLAGASKRDAQGLLQACAPDGWAALTEAVRARSFSERLHQQVGIWSRSTNREEEDDIALAEEGLSPPDRPILRELDWLSSTDAVRSTPFLIAVGKVDGERVLLGTLLERARAGNADLVASYLRGLQHAGHEDEIDTLLRRLRADDAFAETVALTTWRIGATDERLGFIVEDLRAGRLPEHVLSMFTLGSWEKTTSDDALSALLTVLLERNSAQATGIALSLIVHRLAATATSTPEWRQLLSRALEQSARSELGGMIAYEWERGAKLLIAMGDGGTVTRLAINSLGTDDAMGTDEVWSVVRAAAKQDPAGVWVALAQLLESPGRQSSLIAMGMSRQGILELLRAEDVLAWLGHDAARAYLLAEMVSMHDGDDLPPIARALIVRFGPSAPCARLLANHVSSTPHAVSSLADFAAEQKTRARRWKKDLDPQVQKWAERLVAELERDQEEHAAREEYELRRWGT